MTSSWKPLRPFSGWLLIVLVGCASSGGFCQGQETKTPPAPGTPATPPREEKRAAPAPTQTPPTNPLASDLPQGTLARVNGREITLDQYLGYLYASVGKSRLDEFIDRQLIEDEAKAQGLSLSPEQMETALDDRIERTIKGLYQGKRETFLESLTRRRTNFEDYKAKLRQELYYETLLSELILKSRQLTDAELQRQFERTYGEGGVQYVLRHILISGRGPGSAPGGDSSTPPAGRSQADARERAETVLKEIRGGLDFVQAVKQYSDDAATRQNEGRIPLYRKGAYGDAFHKAVLALTPEQPISGIVESNRGFHIIQLIERQVTRFEDVKAEIEKVTRTRPPATAERQQYLKGLRAKAKIEGL
jgi:foldase protein PrsA